MRGMTRKSIITSYFIFAMIAALLITFQGGCQSSPTTPTATSTPTETAGTPAATDTVTITSSGTPAPTPEVSATPEKKSEVQPYSLSKGRRDPFVPFGGAAPSSGGGTQTKTPEPIVKVSKAPDGTATAPPVSTGVKESAMPESVPVQVTGTYASGGKNFAILTSASGGPSFVVSTGDKVGEYKVKSITGTRVVLSWSGKDYVLKMKTFGPHSAAGSKASVTEESNKPKTLQAPAKPAAPPGSGQTQTTPPAGEKPKPEAPPGGGTEKPKGTEVQ